MAVKAAKKPLLCLNQTMLKGTVRNVKGYHKAGNQGQPPCPPTCFGNVQNISKEGRPGAEKQERYRFNNREFRFKRNLTDVIIFLVTC